MTSRPIATEAFPKWIELTGVDPSHFRPLQAGEEDEEDEEPRSYSLGSYDATKTAVAIFDALSLPDDELTAQMLLGRELDAFMEDATFTLADLVNDPASVQAPLGLCRELRAILDRPALAAAREGFVRALETSLEHYGASKRPKVRKLLADTNTLATLRRDALGSLDRLRVSQFLKGDPGDPVRPQYSTAIRRWWNVDHLLAAQATIPEGITLNLVATPAAHDVFFCFAIRRGANLYLLDDAPEYAHPLESQMSRSPGRRMSDRVARFWFPYDLSEVVLSDDGKKAYSRPRKGADKALASPRPIDQVSQVVGTIADLPPEELVWTVLMFDLLAERFFSAQPQPVLPMSYTAGQLRPETPALSALAQGAGLPVVAAPPASLAVPALTRDQVAALPAAPNAEEVLGETGPLQAYAWMERRYGPRVPEEALNQVAPGQDVLRLTQEGKLQVLENPDQDALDHERFFDRDTSLATLSALDPTAIGTASQLTANRAFLARFNYAKSIHGLAEQEYKQREDEVKAWLRAAYNERLDFLLSLAPSTKEHSLDVVDWEPGQGPEQYNFKARGTTTRHKSRMPFSEDASDEGMVHALVRLVPINDDRAAFVPIVPTPKRERGYKLACPITGAKPSLCVLATPTNAFELAWLLGKDVSELPDVLQELGALVPECGNSILDRIDPMLWAVKNPWHQLKLAAAAPLSKRGLAQLQKQHAGFVPDVSALHGGNLRLFTPPAPRPPASPARRP